MEATTRTDAGQLRGATLNALKHGRYAETLLLPGDDPAEFHRRSRAAFHCYRPQTEDEAYQVDAMVEHRWRFERWRPVEAQFDAQAIAPDADAAGRVSEPTAHQRLHSSIDVTLHRARIERLWHRDLSRLLALQEQRRKGLIAGVLHLPPDCYMDTAGRVHGPVAPPVIVPIPEPEMDTDDASGSLDNSIGFYREQNERGLMAGTEAQQSVARPVGRASPPDSKDSTYADHERATPEGLPEGPNNIASASNAGTDEGHEPCEGVLAGETPAPLNSSLGGVRRLSPPACT